MLRALLILLALCVSLPAAAMPGCHDMAMGAAPMTMPMAETRAPEPMPERHGPAAASHVCIGCVPPANWLRAGIAVPLTGRAVPTLSAIRPLDLRRTTPPALPPPKG